MEWVGTVAKYAECSCDLHSHDTGSERRLPLAASGSFPPIPAASELMSFDPLSTLAYAVMLRSVSLTATSVITIALGSGILFFAFKFGFIGVGGTGAYRSKDPFNYWLGVGMTAFAVAVSLALLVLRMFGVV